MKYNGEGWRRAQNSSWLLIVILTEAGSDCPVISRQPEQARDVCGVSCGPEDFSSVWPSSRPESDGREEDQGRAVDPRGRPGQD